MTDQKISEQTDCLVKEEYKQFLEYTRTVPIATTSGTILLDKITSHKCPHDKTLDKVYRVFHKNAKTGIPHGYRDFFLCSKCLMIKNPDIFCCIGLGNITEEQFVSLHIY